MTPERDELHRLIVHRLASIDLIDMTPEQVATVMMGMFATVEDRWSEVDVSTYEDPGKVWIEQRDLICRVPRQQTPARRVANRSV